MRVLLVEDEETIRRFLQMALEDDGHTVVGAANGREALQELDRQPFDLIITNLLMPVMDGWEFLRRYQERPGPHCPVMVCSALVRGCTERELEEQGACCVLGKPFDLERLEQLEQDCLAAKGAGTSERAQHGPAT